MGVAVRTDREGDRASIVPTGSFDLAHATAVATAVESTEASLGGCRSVNVDLSQLDRIDGAGAVLLAGLLDRLDANECATRLVEGRNTNAERLIALYRERRGDRPAPQRSAMSSLDRIGASAAEVKVTEKIAARTDEWRALDTKFYKLRRTTTVEDSNDSNH